MSEINPTLQLAQEIVDLLWRKEVTWRDKRNALAIAMRLLPPESLISINLSESTEQPSEQEVV